MFLLKFLGPRVLPYLLTGTVIAAAAGWLYRSGVKHEAARNVTRNLKENRARRAVVDDKINAPNVDDEREKTAKVGRAWQLFPE